MDASSLRHLRLPVAVTGGQIGAHTAVAALVKTTLEALFGFQPRGTGLDRAERM